MHDWASEEGSPVPLGVTWIPEERAYNFALYSKHADRVTLLLYEPGDVAHPVASFEFDHYRNKTGRVWHTRIPKRQMKSAISNATPAHTIVFANGCSIKRFTSGAWT